jgi:antibiotic biosynthesis monooxygenase (ABM) superfamily enzyme
MSEARASPPVTVLVTRRVRRGQEQEFERLMAGMQAAAADFPGHRGGFLIHPQRAEPGCYRVLFAFDTEAHLQDWTQSRERQRWLRRIADVTHGDAAMRVLSGLETWFELPAARTKVPPPRWKMAVVTWMGIFPLVLLTSYTIAPALGGWIHPLLVTLIVTGLITAAMTWVVMPTLVPLFSNWLYPDAAKTDASASPPSEEQ